jgi:MFS family permease
MLDALSTTTTYPSLRRSPAFLRWATADTINAAGTAISAVVLPILVYERTGSPAQTGLVAGLRVVPYLCFGLIAGPAADRFDRKRLLVVATLSEGLVMATIPIVDAISQVSVIQVYAVTVVAAVCFVFSDAAAFGALPALVGPEHLARANGVLSTAGSVALIAAPPLGAVLTGWIGAAPAVWVDVATFLTASATIATIPGRFRTTHAVTATIRAQARAGMRFIGRHRLLLTLLIVGFANSLAFGAILGQLVVYADRALGLPDGDARVGALFTAGAVGSLVTGVVFGRVFTTDRVPRITPSGLAAAGVIAAGLAATSSFVLAFILYTAFTAAIQLVIVTGITYRQLASPDQLVSSVNVIGRMVAWGGQPFGALLGGLVAQVAGVRWTCAFAAIVFAVAAVAAALLLRPAAPVPA